MFFSRKLAPGWRQKGQEWRQRDQEWRQNRWRPPPLTIILLVPVIKLSKIEMPKSCTRILKAPGHTTPPYVEELHREERIFILTVKAEHVSDGYSSIVFTST